MPIGVLLALTALAIDSCIGSREPQFRDSCAAGHRANLRGVQQTWELLGEILSRLESEALEPIMAATKAENRQIRECRAKAA